MKRLKSSLQELLRYPSVIMGLVIILLLVGLAVAAPIIIPYDEAIVLWRGGEDVWYKNPKTVPPTWWNFFTKEKLVESLDLSTESSEVTKEVNAETGDVTYTLPFEFQADTYPQEMVVYFTAQYTAKKPYVSVTWVKPDGSDPIKLLDIALDKSVTYRIAQDAKLKRKLGGVLPQEGLFITDLKAEEKVPLKGTYQLVIKVKTFEPESSVAAEFVLHGQVYGLFGTDHLRRDLGVALIWGTPTALAFGLLAALGTTLSTMTIAAVGVWFGGWVDELIQRITEVNLVLPFLPILIMIGTFYSRSIWVIFTATILLSIFGGAIKGYRATFLQIKEAPYIEAARSYGAGSIRIVFMYLIPRLIPLLIPTLVIAIPGYVFLEASLAVLGLGDPTLPTWGKIINDASTNGALFKGLYYWILEPAVLLMVAGLAFAMVGFALDRIFNPRLRGV